MIFSLNVFIVESFMDEIAFAVGRDPVDLRFELLSKDHRLRNVLELAAKKELANSHYLTIIDMSLSSNSERFFLIDMNNKKVVHKSKVAHGQNTGFEFAKNFSNKISSHQTSLGFYKTAETYHGKSCFSSLPCRQPLQNHLGKSFGSAHGVGRPHRLVG